MAVVTTRMSPELTSACQRLLDYTVTDGGRFEILSVLSKPLGDDRVLIEVVAERRVTKPGEDVCLRLEDATDVHGSDDWDKLVDQVKVAAAALGYKLRQWGSWRRMGEHYVNEQRLAEKTGDCTCSLRGDPFKAPEQHATSCPWSRRVGG